MPKLPKTLKRNILITAISWLVVLSLFLLQAFVLINHPVIVSLMMLVFLFIAIPVSLLTFIEWLKYLVVQANKQWLRPFITYVCIFGFIFAIGEVISFLIEYRVSYVGLKMVLVFHIIGIMWLTILGSSRIVLNWIIKKLNYKDIVLSEWNYKVLGYGIVLLACLFIRFLTEKLPMFEWIF